MPEPIRRDDRLAHATSGLLDRHPEFASLTNLLAVGVLRTDLDGRCLYVSERATELTGLTTESARQSGWEQCVHPDDRDTVAGQLSPALHGRRSGQAEFRCVLPDGRMHWLLSQATPERDLQGHVVGFVWTLTDTTHIQETLRASEERFKLAAKSAGVGVLDCDVVAAQGLWSPELCAILGVPEGRPVTAAEGFDFCHPDDRARIESAMTAALDPNGSGVFAEEFRIRRADTGETRWIAQACQTFFEGTAHDRRAVRFTGIATDVTERVARETEQQLLRERLLRSEERQAFLLRLSDSLRPMSNPLDMQEVAAQLLGQYLRVNRVGYADLENGRYVIRREYAEGVPPLATQGATRSLAVGLRDAYRRGETVVVTDMETDPRLTEPERVAMRRRQNAAFVSVMLQKDGQLVASFGASHATPRAWTAVEVALIRDVAERTWEAVERARSEAALREREQRLRLALDASRGGSWTLDFTTNHLDWDAGFRTIYGFAPDQTPTSDAWVSQVHEEDRPRVLGMFDEILRPNGRDAWDSTYRIVRPDGRTSWIQSLGRADRNSDGQATRITGLDLDVTETRQAEAAVQARRDEERDRELKLLLETATQGIVSVDAQAKIVTANRALEAMFGWATGELIGRSIEQLVPASLRGQHVKHRAGYFAAPRPKTMGADLELLGQRKDGSTFPIETTLNHVATADGGHVIAFVTDITERRRSEAALQERRIELEQRTAQLSRLASDVTLAEMHAREQLAKTLHDGLQQLLVSAALNVDRHVTREMQRGAAPHELLLRTKSQLDEAIAAARSLSLELFPPALYGSGLPEAMTWLAERTRHQYGLEVRVSVDPRANSDRKDVRTLLYESVRELLFNAVKHAQVERVTVDLSLDHDDALCITVADQGIGFDPSGLVDRWKDGETGWGLFSIRERLTLLGGRFEIDSAPGQGTRFRLVAPRGEMREGNDPQRQRTDVATGAEPAGGTSLAPRRALRILMVDDHPAVRSVFRELLQEHSELQVVGEARDGVEAIEQAHALQPDVILMDISMPRLDGVEATRRIRVELPSIQILGLSTHVKAENFHAIELAGAAGFFNKGVDTQRLIDHLIAVHATTPRQSPRPPLAAARRPEEPPAPSRT